MNTGFLGPAVATVLTVYGIETKYQYAISSGNFSLQQYLPFTVLKLCKFVHVKQWNRNGLQQYLPFTVLKPWTYQAQTSYMSLSCNSTYRLRY